VPVDDSGRLPPYARGACRTVRCDFGCGKTTAMVTPDEQAFLIKALDPLREPLHDVLPLAAEFADAHFGEFDMDGRDYLAGRAHLARCHARRLLLARASTGLNGWTVAPPGPNARLWLTQDALKLRVLRPLPGLDVPPPGPNPARIAYYSNQHTTLFGVAGSDLISLWDVTTTGDVMIRIIRPRGKWKYGATAKVDFDFFLPRPPVSIADLEFRPNDDMDLPLPFESEDEEGEEGTHDSDR
jgi:hypothetical protein